MLNGRTLQSPSKVFRWEHRYKSVLAGLLIVLLIVTSLLSGSSFHEWLHHDAAQDHHQCAITLLQKHHVLLGDASSTFVIVDAGLILTVLPSQTIALPFADFYLSPSRAPPVSPFL